MRAYALHILAAQQPARAAHPSSPGLLPPAVARADSWVARDRCPCPCGKPATMYAWGVGGLCDGCAEANGVIVHDAPAEGWVGVG